MEGDGARGPARQHPHRTMMPLRALLQQEEQREQRRCLQQGCRAKPPSRASHALPKMPVTHPLGQQRPRDKRWGCAWPGGTCGGLVAGSGVACGRVTSSHWDAASTGSLLQLSPLQSSASPGAATKCPHPRFATLTQPWGQTPRCHRVPSSPGATSIPAAPFAGAAQAHRHSDAASELNEQVVTVTITVSARWLRGPRARCGSSCQRGRRGWGEPGWKR